MTSWHTYPKIYNIGHPLVNELFLDPVTIEEKVDGSQFSFGVHGGELKCRSKGQELHIDAPDKMFAKAVETAKKLAPLLRPDWTYRGEYLQKPKHNTLAYDRHPKDYIVIFDISPAEVLYLSYEEKLEEANLLGLECVPLLYRGVNVSLPMISGLLDRTSFLGGQKIEGVVVKNYYRFGRDGKVLLGKYVSEAFKEIHIGEWRAQNPKASDIIDRLVTTYATPARWNKAVQHLKEDGKLEGSPKDIGALIKEAQEDLEEECNEEIKDALWEWAGEKVLRGTVKGLAQWYKDELLKNAFHEKGDI